MRELGKHVFIFNEHDNGGESLSLTTSFFDNGDGIPQGLYLNQELTLSSYGNSATFTLCGATLTPKLLRELANQLDEEIAKLTPRN